MEKKPISSSVAGLIIGLVAVIFFLGYYFTGLIFQRDALSFLPALIYLVLIIVFINAWAKSQNNFVTFGSCFGYGFKTVCVATLIIVVFSLAFIYITPEYKDQFIQSSKEQMRQNKQATDEQIDTGIKWVSDHFMLLTVGGGLFFNLLIGVIGALIGAAVTKKKPVDPFTQINQTGGVQP